MCTVCLVQCNQSYMAHISYLWGPAFVDDFIPATFWNCGSEIVATTTKGKTGGIRDLALWHLFLATLSNCRVLRIQSLAALKFNVQFTRSTWRPDELQVHSTQLLHHLHIGMMGAYSHVQTLHYPRTQRRGRGQASKQVSPNLRAFHHKLLGLGLLQQQPRARKL